jgi:hypothetical protein
MGGEGEVNVGLFVVVVLLNRDISEIRINLIHHQTMHDFQPFNETIDRTSLYIIVYVDEGKRRSDICNVRMHTLSFLKGE